VRPERRGIDTFVKKVVFIRDSKFFSYPCPFGAKFSLCFSNSDPICEGIQRILFSVGNGLADDRQFGNEGEARLSGLPGIYFGWRTTQCMTAGFRGKGLARPTLRAGLIGQNFYPK
jgi:hypothetical protein